MRNREESYKARLAIVFYLIVLIAILISARLFSVQVINRGRYISEVEAQLSKDYNVIKAERGEILDRNGQTLAFSQPYYQFDLNPLLLTKEEKNKLVKQLPDIININVSELNKYMEYKSYVIISRDITLEQKSKIEQLNISNGITLTKVYKRVYPYGEYFSQVTGFVGVDDNGLSGAEYEFENYLKGENGRVFKNFVSTRPILPGEASYSIEPKKGDNVFLTIDSNIQYKAQSLIEEKGKELNAKSGLILVMNPSTGEVLAMANYPTFDPNNLSNLENAVNRSIGWNYEPGSILKPVVAAAALEEGFLKINDEFYCGGSIRVKDRVISCWQRHSEEKGLKEILKNSCDVAFAQIGLKMGSDNLIDLFKRFGFGKATKIELPGEESGILPNKDKVGEVEAATMAFGQGIAVTPLQLISAFSAVINNGVQVKPTVLKEIRDESGKTIYEEKTLTRNIVISKETSQIMRDALVYTVNEGIKNAKIKGIDVLGKTGTAQKVVDGKYSKTKLIYSFIGAFPANNPQVAILVVIDETPVPMYSIDITPPIFKELAEYILKYLRIENEQ